MTAFTFTVTLSLVMHSWLGTSIVTVRRSTSTMWQSVPPETMSRPPFRSVDASARALATTRAA